MNDLSDVLYEIDNTSMRNVVLLGFTPEVLDKARKHLEELSLSGKEEVIISFKKEDFEVIDSFVKSQCLIEYQDMMRYSLIKDHIYYLIIKQIKMDIPEKRFLKYYENCFEAIKNNDFDVYRKNHVEFLFGYNDSMVPKEELNNFRVNFFVDDYNNSIIQEVINSLISSRCETIFVYSSADNLLTNKCGDSIIQTIHDYSLLNSAKLTKKISDSINKMTQSGDYVETPVKQTKEEANDNNKYKTLADYINGAVKRHNVVFLGQDRRKMKNVTDLIKGGKYKEIAVTFYNPTRNAINDFISKYKTQLTEEDINQIYREYILYEVLKQLKHKYSEAKELSKKIKPLIQAMLVQDFDKFSKAKEESYSLESLGIIIDERINFIDVPLESKFQQFQHQINDYFNKYCHVTISTNEDQLNNYECSDGTVLRKGLNFEEAITPRIEFKRISDEKKKVKEIENKAYFWYPMENYVKKSKKMIPIPKSEYYLGDKPESTTIEVDLNIVHHDYYGIKDLLGKLPIEVLPISKEAIDRLNETDLKSVFEKTLASTYGETFIRSIDKIAIMGFDSFKNKAKVYRKSAITTVERFYKGYDERKQFVTANNDQLFNYLIKLLTAKKDNRFIPIKTLSNCGSYNNYHSYRDFIRAITSVDERILESISLYMEKNDMTKEEPFKNAARRLINTPNKERKLIKKGL